MADEKPTTTEQMAELAKAIAAKKLEAEPEIIKGSTNSLALQKAIKEAVAPEEPDRANIRKYGVDGEFDTETYRQLFNGFLIDPTILNISTKKPISQMDNEELTAWIYKLDEFTRTAKVAKQAARVTIEDRKLQMTEDQKKKQYELDKKYKPQAPARASKTTKSKTPKSKMTEEEKRIKACMDLMGKNETDAIAWLKEKGRL